MPNCLRCGTHVSQRYKKVAGHPRYGGEVPTCLSCVGRTAGGTPVEDLDERVVIEEDVHETGRGASRADWKRRKGQGPSSGDGQNEGGDGS